MSDLRVRAAWNWYLGGTASMGLATGVLAGASASPVIGTLLPLLFALLGGSSGLYLAKADLLNRIAWTKLKLIGILVSAFVIALLVGSAYGIRIRTGASLRALLGIGERQVSLFATDPTDTDDALELVLMNRRLELLNVSSQDRLRVLNRYRADLQRIRDRETASAAFQALAGAADTVAIELGEAMRVAPGSPPAGVQDLARELPRMAADFRFLSTYLSRGNYLGRSAASDFLITTRMIVDRAVQDVIGFERFDVPSLRRLRLQLGTTRAWLQASNSPLEATVRQRVDELIVATHGAGNPESRPERPAFTTPP